ncbi:MAG TPA: FumA C-terminus/TtdB family hydratase beta subunit [Candidatus Methanofastidiosa archaeon]|nr:FumA C-terminus/TtdB family hydratase beta subunit [Candidatus Methanofastidiosa archaeon]
MKNLDLPLSGHDVTALRLGESVLLNGRMFTARDDAHMHLLKLDEEPPVDFRGSAVFHCGPIMRRTDDGWAVVAAGPTTSFRMNGLEPEFIERFGVRAIVGKGGMSKETVDAMKEHGCVYLALTGGAAVIAAKGIQKVNGVHLQELGMAEAVWDLQVKEFGPLTVAIDAHGNSLYDEIDLKVKSKLPFIKGKLGID